ncbi:SDR family oxidoreductase [Proteus mirabilis]|uniref:SDR family oxidoreductase n=1 Tax=Proteus mirabilis TaxID=584 RepID=UPI000F5D21CA|nr:SDR family oxidoreductase [Proteus mirabilis]AZG99923.1 SDR family oxidoreductase [Proteus mirabilis]MCI9767781.1 SDR family oxidoreductase [Proteus mirabilis]MCI9771370.1 SDR family oxidoreductase [Proteus mirabilis]MCI9774963.1 SDR family oxidoreductase [Proteus mirabilis]MDM3648543.1 SDR family oxidoreductase [Proteus mirabilis]
MNILVIGARGRVGQRLIKILLAEGHHVIGTTRKLSHTSVHHPSQYHEIELDITKPLSSITDLLPDNLEAIYFTTGSRGKDLLQVDLHGAVKTMQAAEKKGIKRYIMLSAINSLSPDKWTELIDYFTAKYFADLYLRDRTQLDFTIVQAGYLTEKQGTYKITTKLEDDATKGEIAIDNVAETLAEMLDKPNTFKKCISILDGDEAIKTALSRI